MGSHCWILKWSAFNYGKTFYFHDVKAKRDRENWNLMEVVNQAVSKQLR